MLKMVTWREDYACQSSSSEDDMCSLCFSNISVLALNVKYQFAISAQHLMIMKQARDGP